MDVLSDHSAFPGGPRSADPVVATVVDADRKHVLHGFAPLRRQAEPGPIFRSAAGLHLTDVHGNDWLDACAGQANVSLGYGRDDLADVAWAAMRRLSFGTTFYHNRGHVAGAQLAEKLTEITPHGLDQFFYTLGGSDAVETAIKIARYANIVIGRPEKIHIIGRVRSYHGVSYGALSMTGDPEMWRQAGPRLPGFSHIEQPESGTVGAAKALEDEILRVGPEKVAAFMAEPISTPNGIVVPPEDYWPQVREICSKYDVLLIADEVLTGFGRAGQMFALQNWDVRPDMMTMSKAITAGYFPLSAVGLTSELVKRLETGGEDGFRHGLTNSGHAVGCAVALATIDIMEREDVVARGAEAGQYLVQRLGELADRHPALKRHSIRAIGLMVAIDFDAAAAGPEFGPAAHAQFVRERLFVRDYLSGQTIGFLPSLTATAADLDEIVQRMDNALTTVEATR